MPEDSTTNANRIWLERQVRPLVVWGYLAIGVAWGALASVVLLRDAFRSTGDEPHFRGMFAAMGVALCVGFASLAFTLRVAIRLVKWVKALEQKVAELSDQIGKPQPKAI
ncbi:MAG TPA: hypothetical protein VM487_14975 [Phycisphaerae bacterium]|nr:hypothetical protein [Phycisphaerae bacterium]